MANDEFGDFQTPTALVEAVLNRLNVERFRRVLEPTCGIGNFLRGVSKRHSNAELRGVEVQEQYAAVAAEFAEVLVSDAMKVDFGTDVEWRSQGKLLVVGNPPWVTNAALTNLGSDNKPKLKNIRGLKGLDAMTGASNFDIAEAIILKLIGELEHESPTIAMLCKTQVARNVLSYCEQFNLGVMTSQIYEIDAMKWFNAGVDACLFVIELNPHGQNYIADLYESLDDEFAKKQIGVVGNRLVSDVAKYVHTKAADGLSPIMWRQGIKHDGTKAMELVEADGPHRKSGDPVDVESDFLYPLLKCTDVFRGRTSELTKWMVVPQRHTGDDTALLMHTAPKLWKYLTENSEILDNRKSSIYRKRPRFCIFGVGEYSFSTYKVAISAMHKKPLFRLVAPINGQPVVFDDVCYFASFQDLDQAALVAAILGSRPAQDLIDSLVFTDSKRPITKKLLQRIDLSVLVKLNSISEIVSSAKQLAEETGAWPPSDEQLEAALEALMISWGGNNGNEMLFDLKESNLSAN